jgi:hypothetical protein
MYGRGFVAAMGREFYGAVAGDPEMGVPYAECEEMSISSRICPAGGSGNSRYRLRHLS